MMERIATVVKPAFWSLIVVGFVMWLLVSGITTWTEARGITEGGFIPSCDYDGAGESWVDVPVYRLNKRIDAVLRLAFSALAVVTSAIMYRHANLHARRARIQNWRRLHRLWNVPGRFPGQTKPIHR